MTNILLLQENGNTHSVKRILEEASAMEEINVRHVSYSDLTININSTSGIALTDTENTELITNYDKFIFRSSKRPDGIRYSQINKALKTYITSIGKYSLNQDFTQRNKSELSKIHNYILFANQDIPLIPTRIYLDKKTIKETNFPLIAKLARGSHGEDVYFLRNLEELQTLVNSIENISEVLFQDFIDSIDTNDNRFDIRVITIGDTVQGAMKKTVDKSKIITNYSGGANVESFELTEGIINLCKRIHSSLQLEYSGIDIIFQNGQPFVLEVNPACQFEGFENATGINIAKKLLEHVIQAT